MNYRWYITTICILALKLSRPSSSRPRIVGAIAFGASLQSCTANPTWHFHLRKFATWERINSNWTQHWIDEHPHMKHFRFVVGFLIRVGFHEKPGQGMPPARKLHHGEFDATISGEEASKLSCDDGDAIFFRMNTFVKTIYVSLGSELFLNHPSFCEVWWSKVWEPTHGFHCGVWSINEHLFGQQSEQGQQGIVMQDWNRPKSFLICVSRFFPISDGV